MKLSDTRIATRLSVGFGLLFLLLAMAVGVALVKIGQIRNDFREVTDEDYPTTMTFVGVKDDVNVVARGIRNMILLSDPAAVQAEHDRIKSSLKSMEEHFAKGSSLLTRSEEKAVFAKMVAARDAYLGPLNHVMALVQAGDVEQAKAALIKDLRPVQNALLTDMDEMAKLQSHAMSESSADVEKSVAAAKEWLFGFSAVALVISVTMARWITRSITQPMNQAVSVSRAVAAGDLSMQFDSSGYNETAQLLQALQDMQTNLVKVVGGVRQSADSVATASAQISQGNHDLSQRTEEQASALEQTAASMEELSSAVKQNADNARQANQFAMGANAVATKGSEVVGQVVQTMKGINDSSRKISDIIGVIDGIAFQTNILALNAAVEAARAGEQGRGFAVVAAEVRSLAGRSAEAAKEIKTLINASVERVDQGAALVDQAGATMTEVLNAIRRVTDIMGEISAASSEQSSGVSQVGQAVMQMDQVTQQNAALVEESAAAAESLKAQAEQLVQAVAVFKLSHVDVDATAPVSTPIRSPKPAALQRAPVAPARKPQAAVRPAAPVLQIEATPAKLPAPTDAGSDHWETF